jgi:rieske iron-sulfur protein
MQANRRDVFTAACALAVDAALRTAVEPAAAEPTDERPKEGDYLVAIDAADPAALSPRDIAAPQLIAWPMEPATRLVRNGSRLNKVLVVRLDPATLVGATRERAAGGVVAYSAICPHAGCEVSGWIDDHQRSDHPRFGGASLENRG